MSFSSELNFPPSTWSSCTLPPLTIDFLSFSVYFFSFGCYYHCYYFFQTKWGSHLAIAVFRCVLYPPHSLISSVIFVTHLILYSLSLFLLSPPLQEKDLSLPLSSSPPTSLPGFCTLTFRYLHAFIILFVFPLILVRYFIVVLSESILKKKHKE